MELLRLMKYPGSKGVLIPEIRRVFRESGKRSFIDVFGGSGTVSLNVRSIRTVYNEVDPDLVNIFLVLQREPELLTSLIENRVSRIAETNAVKRGRRTIREGGRTALSSSGLGGTARSIAVRTACENLLKFSTSFGGFGDTYATTKEKASEAFLLKLYRNLPRIAQKVRQWKIEELDFRPLMKKYDSEDAFFYLDPPYISRKWYNYNMEMRDFVELKKMLTSIKGRYLMNLDSDEEDLTQLFGKPAFVKSYPNENAGMKPPQERFRVKLFYTNVRPKPQ